MYNLYDNSLEIGINLVAGQGHVYNFGTEILSVLQFHRKIQVFLDDNIADIYDSVTDRHDDFIISMVKPYKLTEESFKYLKDGTIIQDGKVYDLLKNIEVLHDQYIIKINYLAENLDN